MVFFFSTNEGAYIQLMVCWPQKRAPVDYGADKRDSKIRLLSLSFKHLVLFHAFCF